MNNDLSPPTMVAERPAVTNANAHSIMESVLMRGDLGKLSPAERNTYYMQTCQSLGLNPLTRPFEYIVLNGKMTLYAKRDCADQLRKINNISVEIVSRELDGDLFTVHVRANDSAGRRDEDYGVVTLGMLKGEARANAILKAVTKAKRRVTLSICGLGFLDETEIADIPGARIGADGWPQGSIEQPGDYDGVPEKQTKPKAEPQYTRLMNAAMTHLQRTDVMVHELEICEHVDELDAMACEIETRPEYKQLPQTQKDRIAKAYAATLASLQTQVVHDSDGVDPRPARSDDFVEPPPRDENGLAQRAIAAREHAAMPVGDPNFVLHRPSRSLQRANASPKADPTDPDLMRS